LKANKVVIGDWSRDTVRLDFDDTPLDEVKFWSYRACSWFHLEGFIVLESSRKEYVNKVGGEPVHKWTRTNHLVIFNRSVSWDLNVRIMNWVALQCRNTGLSAYVKMQCIKRSSTVRIGSKGNKPPPRIVFRYGQQEGQIAKFRETRRFVLDALGYGKVD